MNSLCSEDISFQNISHSCGDIPNKPIDELLKRQVELYLQFNPEYEFDRVEMEWCNGHWVATPIYKHRQINRVDDLKDRANEFRSQNIV